MKILVWDLPTRLFHWLLAGAFAVAYVTGEVEALFPLHVFAGLLLAVLILYRLVWGLIGSRYARFSSFLFSPGAAFHYGLDMISGRARHYLGHNPLGSWAIYLLLSFGLLTAASGLLTLVGAKWLEEVHEVFANGMLMLVLVHLAGVLVGSLVHRENLPRSMVTGLKKGQAEDAIPSRRPVGALVLIALVAVLSWGFVSGYDGTRQTLSLPAIGLSLSLAHEGHGEHEDHDREH